MDINDPELLTKETFGRRYDPSNFKYRSLFCRNQYHVRCKMTGCECDCHKAEADKLKEQLLHGMDHIYD